MRRGVVGCGRAPASQSPRRRSRHPRREPSPGDHSTRPSPPGAAIACRRPMFRTLRWPSSRSRPRRRASRPDAAGGQTASVGNPARIIVTVRSSIAMPRGAGQEAMALARSRCSGVSPNHHDFRVRSSVTDGFSLEGHATLSPSQRVFCITLTTGYPRAQCGRRVVGLRGRRDRGGTLSRQDCYVR